MLDRVREELELRLEAGAHVAELERELVEAATVLSEEERAALWLFAWSYRPGHGDSERVVSVAG